MTTGVSACVIARDEGAVLARCLASLAWADERIVVLDPRGDPATRAAARDAGARVIHHPYGGNVEQKNVALDEARGEWVVALDADEALSAPLQSELRARIAADRDLAGIEINRVTHHLGRWIRHGDFFPDWQLRVFRRGRGRWRGANPHGRVVVDGPVVRARGECEHRSYADLADQLARVQAFSDVEAERLFRAGRRARLSDLVARPPARFLRAYLLRRGFLDGVPGLAIATVTAFHVFLKYAKLWELERGGAGGGP